MFRPKIQFLPLLALAALTLAGCNSTSNPGTGGDTINSGSIAAGGNFPHTFNTAGTFNYKCTIHPSCAGLMGRVTVVEAATTIQPANHQLSISISTGGTCFLLSVPADSVHVGELVTWNNNSAAPHTVTSQ